MKKHCLHLWLLILVCTVVWLTPAWADKLETRDGETVSGQFLGGSQQLIVFKAGNRPHKYQFEDVLRIVFGDKDPGKSSGASADELLLNDGRRVTGEFIAGAKDKIEMSVNDEHKEFKLGEVSMITFAGGTRDNTSTSHSRSSGSYSRSSTSHSSSSTADSPPVKVTIPAGTTLMVKLDQTLKSDKQKEGESFMTSLEADLVVDDMLVAPQGSKVYGTITDVKDGRRSRKVHMTLVLQDIKINGQMFPLKSSEYKAEAGRHDRHVELDKDTLLEFELVEAAEAETSSSQGFTQDSETKTKPTGESAQEGEKKSHKKKKHGRR